MWSGAPLTVRVYVVLIVASALGIAVLGDLAFGLLALGLALGLGYFLLKGVRWLWLLLVCITIPGPVIDLLSGVAWYNTALAILALALLLAPETRRHFAREAIATEY